MSRSIWKLPYISLLFFQNRILNGKFDKIRIRNSIIPSIYMEKRIKILVFNGIWYLSILISNNMQNCKFGEFSYTKRSDRQTHLKQKRKKKPKGKK